MLKKNPLMSKKKIFIVTFYFHIKAYFSTCYNFSDKVNHTKFNTIV